MKQVVCNVPWESREYMVGDLTESNAVTITGKIVSDLRFSHEIYGEGFYHFLIEVPRLSESCDNISVTISERLTGYSEFRQGIYVTIEGQFRSYNNFGGSGSKLLLTVFARNMEIMGESSGISRKNSNQIFLNGYICKKPVYRSTPFGREITDLLIAVNRAYNKSDYIPCISWGRNARFCSTLNIGDNIRVWGRIQSRQYQKKISENELITRIAYEVSLAKLEFDAGKGRGAAEILDGTVAGSEDAPEGTSRLRTSAVLENTVKFG